MGYGQLTLLPGSKGADRTWKQSNRISPPHEKTDAEQQHNSCLLKHNKHGYKWEQLVPC